MNKNMLYLGIVLTVILVLAGISHAVDFRNLADQSTYRCPGGVVAVGDPSRDVRQKCGDPFEIGRLQDFGPIWIYYREGGTFMYYLAILNGKLQRIVGAPCTPDDPACLDLE